MSPVIGGDLVSSALPVGVFEWWVENPGPDPLTIGIMLTWQDPAADPDEPAPPGAWHESIESARAGGAILHASAGAPSGLRGTFALAASRAAGTPTTTAAARARTRDGGDAEGNYRASLYLRLLAIWAIEEALARRASAGRR